MEFKKLRDVQQGVKENKLLQVIVSERKKAS